MRKLFSLLLVLGLGIVLVSGCQTTTSTKTTPDGASVASSLGGMAYYCTAVDGTALGLMGTTIGTGIKAAAAGDLEYTNGWWTFTYTVGTMSYSYKVRAYTSAGAQITIQADLGDTNKIEMALTFAIGSTITYTFGTESAPLIYDGLQAGGTKSINGTISVSITDEDGKAYAMTMTYSGTELDSYGRPVSGTTTVTFTSDDYVTVSGTITWGGATATLEFSEPAGLTGVTYTIDMEDGSVTTAGL